MWKSCRLLTIVLAAAVGGIIALALLPYFLAFVVAPNTIRDWADRAVQSERPFIAHWLLRPLANAGEAIAYFEKALSVESDHFFALTHYARAVAIPDPERALAFLQASYQANSSYENTLRLMAVALADLGREEKALEKVKEFLKLRPQATLDDWKRPNSRSHPHVAERREHMRATLKRLGVPESGQHASARP